MHLPIVYIEADLPEGKKQLLACFANERLDRGERLPSELLMGVLLEPAEDFQSGVSPDNFGLNTTFHHFLHQAIGQYAPDTVRLREMAENVGNGVVHVIDERAPKPEPGKEWVISSEDVLGEFDVKDGEIVDHSYRPNSDHRILSSRGFLQLEDELMEFLQFAAEQIPMPEGDFIAGSWGLIH